MGVILSLKKVNLLSSQKLNYLFGVQKRRSERQLSVKDLVGPHSSESVDDLIKYWDQRLNTEDLQKFLRFHLLIRQGLIEEKLSVARAAELFGLGQGEMEELANYWAAEVSGEAAH